MATAPQRPRPAPFHPGLPVLPASTRAGLTSNVPPAQHGNGREIPSYNSQMASEAQKQKKIIPCKAVLNCP